MGAIERAPEHERETPAPASLDRPLSRRNFVPVGTAAATTLLGSGCAPAGAVSTPAEGSSRTAPCTTVPDTPTAQRPDPQENWRVFSAPETVLAFRNHGMHAELLREPITPLGAHVLLVHFDIPRLSAENYSIAIGGRVRAPVRVSLDALKSRRTITQAVTMECAGTGRSTMRPRWQANGQPLLPQHGFPLRLIVPSWYGMASVKWLRAITVLNEPFRGVQQAKVYRYQQRKGERGEPVQHKRVHSVMMPPGIPDLISRHRSGRLRSSLRLVRNPFCAARRTRGMRIPRHLHAVVLAAALAQATAPEVHAQSSYRVQGRVSDGTSATAVAGARVAAIDARGAISGSALTGPSGTFVVAVPHGTTRIITARVGFSPETLAVEALGDTTLAIVLRRAPLALDEVIIGAERSFSAASASTIREVDIRLRPHASSQDLLELAPGLVIAQHAGGGKAEQIFLRGFDADHGTDVAVSVDGTPVNLVSHAHGQGYADLHFVIPEVVERVDVRKGPFDARDGDFATAGSVALSTRDRIDASTVTLRAGGFRTSDLVTLISLGRDAATAGGYLAFARRATRGPFDSPQDFSRLNGFGKWTAPLGTSTQLVTSISTFSARWSASGQIPERAASRGLIGRFGAIDPTEGGTTERHDVSIAVRSTGAGSASWQTRAYASRYRLALFSNFSFFLADTVDGDGIEQDDDRVIAGLDGRYGASAMVLGRHARWEAGAGVRSDAGDVALHHQRQRQRLGTTADARVSQQHLHTWQRIEVALSDRVRLELGARADVFGFGVRDRLGGADEIDASGRVWRGIMSPKANLALDISPLATLFVNAATGFHSNDARDVARAGRGAPVLPRAVAAEVGGRRSWTTGSLAAALWITDFESELVWVGDEGTTEPKGRTRRAGLDVEARVRLTPWLWMDTDVNIARGRFRDLPRGEDRIPLAPKVTSTGGLTVRDAGPLGGGLRYRFVGPRAADERAEIVARGATVWELFGSWQRGRVGVTLAIDNLFDTEWNEAQFATTSRLRDESAPVTELHFTPGAPRRLEMGIELRLRSRRHLTSRGSDTIADSHR
ncbi:MAG: TonB-dependent receptor domain-containing protein [Gemmatimonadaceae bacterium]